MKVTHTVLKKPKLFYQQNDLAIAVKHYKQHDYPAACKLFKKVLRGNSL